MHIERILFPTDFSEGARHALPYAVDLAKQYDARLFIVHVVYDVVSTSGWYVPHIPLDELFEDMSASALKEMERGCLDIVGGYKNVEHMVVRGLPKDEIIRFAVENQIDLIVIGTHGRSGIDRILFGSTAERVVRKAPCPVLSVRLPEHRQE